MKLKLAHINKTQLWRTALIRKRIWWWADDPDNPFGVALLACPRISPLKSKVESLVYLYTIDEASSWSYPKLIARERGKSKFAKIGWAIYNGKNPTDWTLPDRLNPNVIVKLIRVRMVRYNRNLKRKKEA